MGPTIWDIGVPVLSVVIVGVGIFLANTSKYFTIREHQEFAEQIKGQREILRTNLQREIDAIIRRIETLEQTRPTIGELEARFRQYRENGK